MKPSLCVHRGYADLREESVEPPTHSNNRNLNEALRLAKQGTPVFPCKPDKRPFYQLGTLENGHKAATTDEDQIRKWWTRWPDAGIGVPTGERSGWWVLDVDLDPDKGIDGYRALAELENRHEKLPKTHTVGTRRGGQHKRFLVPKSVTIKNSCNRPAKGIDIRGEGGYVLVPPTTGYRVDEDRPIAEAPQWLCDAITKQQRDLGVTGGDGDPEVTPGSAPSQINANLDGPAIPYGQRNDTLTRIAGKLHDGTRSFGKLMDDLEVINRARCVPPIGNHPTDREPDEVARIARSIYNRAASKRAAPRVGLDVLDELGRIEDEHLWGRMWQGRKLKIARSVFASLIVAAREYGTLIPAGIRLSLSERDLSLRAGLSRRAVEAAICTLRQELGLLRKDNHGRHPKHSGAFVLLKPRAKNAHSTTGGLSPNPGKSGYSLRAPRLRPSSPGSGKRVRGTVRGTSKVRQVAASKVREPVVRLDKGAEEVVDWLDRTGGTLGVKHLADIVGCRARDLRARALAKLEAAGVVRYVEDDAVALVPAWLERLNDDRELTGEFDAYERDRRLYERERAECWRSEAAEDHCDEEPKDREQQAAKPLNTQVPEILGPVLGCWPQELIAAKYDRDIPYQNTGIEHGKNTAKIR